MVTAYDYDDLYARLLTRCPGLVEIKAQRVSKQTLQKLGLTAGSELRVVDLEIAGTVGLDLFIKSCPKLVSLSLSGEYFRATDALVRTLVNHCPLVERLSFSGWTGLTDISLITIRSLLHLRDLMLPYGEGLTWSGMQKFVKNSPNLEVFHFVIHQGSVDEVLRCLSLFCPRLRAFHCYKNAVTHDAVVALLQGCPLLEEVVIDEYSPNDQVLCTVAEYCSKMRLFSFNYLSPDPFTDRGLIALSLGCPGLTELHINCSNPVTDDAILCVAEHCHKLVTLKVDPDASISSQSVCAVIKANPGLTRVSFTHCLNNDYRCLVALANCPNLKSVQITYMERISKASYKLFTTNCRNLEKIDFCYCDISDALIDDIARHSRHLQQVVICLCRKITQRSILSLLMHSKNLRQLYAADCNIVITSELRHRLSTLSVDQLVQRSCWVTINSQSWDIFPQ